MTAYDWATDTGLLILRVVLGLTMAAHGYNKFFGGGRIPGHRRLVRQHRDEAGHVPRPDRRDAPRWRPVSVSPLGLLTPIPAAGFVALMLVAAWTVHRPNGFFIVKEGWEYNLVLACRAVGVATIGAGKFSLDHLLFSTTSSTTAARLVGSGRSRWASVSPAASVSWRSSTGRRPRPTPEHAIENANRPYAARTRSSLDRHGIPEARRCPSSTIAEWSKGTRAEKIRPMARHWAEVGFGTPVVLHLFYVVKILLYILGAWLFALATKGIDGFTNVASWWTEPIVFQKVVLYTMLFEVVGLGCGFGPLNNRFFPPMGSILYWLRPSTIRLPPWPNRVPLTKGTTRTPVDVAAVCARCW